MNKTVHDIIEELTQKLISITGNKETAHQEAWWLLEAITNKSKTELLLQETLELNTDQTETLHQWVADRVDAKKPLQYILGSAPFCTISILVKPPVLIPRPETEEWTSWLIKKITDVLTNEASLNILDLCSGSGCIALALAKALPKSTIIGLDISPEAIELSQENKRRLQLKNVRFLCSDLYEAVEDQKHSFDLIVSNPPYVTQEEWDRLSQEVRDWEDPAALIAQNDGIEIHRKIIKRAKEFLRPHPPGLQEHDLPQVLFEIGASQAKAVTDLLEQEGFNKITIHQDLEGKDRWVTAALPR